jgi:hypothetical protein
MENMKKRTNKLAAPILFFVTLLLGVCSADGAPTAPLPVTGAAGIGMDNPTLQAQLAEMESMRLNQIKNALLSDFWTQYRLYIQALAAGNSTTEAIYPMWPLSSTPNDPKANFQYLADKYLPDLKDQLKSLSRTTGIPETDFYEIQYFPPEAGVPLPASGHVVIRRLHSETATQGRIRGLLAAVTVENIGEHGVISMRVDPPSAFMGSDALNIALVRNNGLTLDPDVAKQLADSETGGPDLTFLPGTWVTFGKKSTNIGTAQAKNVDPSTVHTPTIRFKGKDGNIIGLNALEMEQVIGDPVARILFKRTAAALGGTMDANYIRFEDNRGAIVGLEHIYRRDGPDGRSGSNLTLAIWAHTALGGDTIILNAGDTVNGETANQGGVIRFGLNNSARVFLDGDGKLKIEANRTIHAKAPTIILEGDVNISGKSTMQGAVTMQNGLDMSNTDINNVRNLRAATAILNSLTLGGRTGSQSSPYNVWVTNAANATNASYAADAGHASVADTLGPGGWDSIPWENMPTTPSEPPIGGGNVIADELTEALWDRIRELIGDGGGSGGGGGTRIGSGGTGNMSHSPKHIAFDPPFPNECTKVTITNVTSNYGNVRYEVSNITRDGFDIFATGNEPGPEGHVHVPAPINFQYIAIGN